MATGLFATVAINTGADGLFYANPAHVVASLIAVSCSWIWAAGATFVMLKVLDATIGLRVPRTRAGWVGRVNPWRAGVALEI